MLDPLAYTKENLEQELNLLEIHLKEAPYSDEAFCKDCCDKHLSTIRAYSLEGLSFTNDENEIKTFSEIAKTAQEMRKGGDYRREGIEMSQRIRSLRKQLSNCPTCEKIIQKIRNNPNLPKDLNRSLSINQNNPNNLNKNQKGGISMDLKQVGIINAGAFLGKGVEVLADYVDTQFPTAGPEWYKRPSTYIDVVGGLGLQLLALYGIKNENVKLLTVVTGANMITKSVDIAKEALAPAPTARLPTRAAPLRVTRPMAAPMVSAGLVTVD